MVRVAAFFVLLLLLGGTVSAQQNPTQGQQPQAQDQPAQPSIQGGLCEGAELKLSGTPTEADCKFADANPEKKLNSIIATVINIFSVVVGVVAVIMIIIGGFRYITSGGDSGNVSSAKNTILYAIVGLVIVALAQFIVKFVLSKTTSF